MEYAFYILPTKRNELKKIVSKARRMLETQNSKYESRVKDFESIIDDSYKETFNWFIKELISRRDSSSSEAGYIEFNRNYAFFKKEQIDFEEIPDSSEIKLSAENTFFCRIWKKTGIPKIYDKPDINIARLTLDFSPSKILFELGSADKAYSAFEDVINTQFGERVVSLDDMKNIYLKKGFLEKSYIYLLRNYSKIFNKIKSIKE